MAQSPSTPNQPLGSLPWRGNIEPSSVKSLPRAVLQDTNDHHFFFGVCGGDVTVLKVLVPTHSTTPVCGGVQLGTW